MKEKGSLAGERVLPKDAVMPHREALYVSWGMQPTPSNLARINTLTSLPSFIPYNLLLVLFIGEPNRSQSKDTY